MQFSALLSLQRCIFAAVPIFPIVGSSASPHNYREQSKAMDHYNLEQLNSEIKAESAFIQKIMEGMSRTIIGQEALVRALLIGLLADGHILLEGVPGLAKTLAIKTLSDLIQGDYSRIQFTPDLLPSDVVGTLMYSRNTEQFMVKRGPIFAHFVLADEINRAPAKVQSALLEAMQERQVTLGDTTHKLPHPFLVLATQNPLEQEGTYPLPEAQVDRFMLKVHIGYPTREEEQRVVRLNMEEHLPQTQAVVTTQDIIKARSIVRKVYVDDKIVRYIVDLVFATREPESVQLHALKPYILCGASPRASISLTLAARAHAFIEGRGYVLPEDVRAVAHDVLRHRIALSYEAEANEVTTEELITQIINQVEVP